MITPLTNSISETLKKAYDDSFLMGEVKGIEKGIEQGTEQAKREVVLNILSKNMDEKLINYILGLSIDRVIAIKKESLDKIH